MRVLDSAGVPLSVIADQIGHSNRTTTEGYIHRDRTTDDDVADLAARLLAPETG